MALIRKCCYQFSNFAFFPILFVSFFNSHIMTGSYNNFFKVFNRKTKREVMFEAAKDCTTMNSILKQRKVIHSTMFIISSLN